ncbi:MAG: hypothetical protein KC419_00985 [Anaerolineales bacterium]|nr:hypothetical protein [Anaerolineales bacterium]MCA9927011.1 hypothetical protein [Anaerolineales bacterium]
MRNEYSYNRTLASLGMSRKTTVGIILIIALIAFETFNFDTTQYALENLLGDVRFLGLQWASILAIAFCSIDFAGLIRIFTPEKGSDEPREVSFLMGAWLLGATMNAIMTWWAISLTLMNHNVGNQVLSSQQLLLYVPIFVAVLVWLTRILFIGAFTVAGEHIFDFAGTENRTPAQARLPQNQTRRVPASTATSRKATRAPMRAAPKPQASRAAMPVQEAQTQVFEPEPVSRQPAYRPVAQQQSRVRQRPPRPNGNMRRTPVGMQAKERH